MVSQLETWTLRSTNFGVTVAFVAILVIQISLFTCLADLMWCYEIILGLVDIDVNNFLHAVLFLIL